jgi:hypothetical protein
MMRDDIDPSRFSDRGKAFRFLLAAAAVMLPLRAWAAEAGAAKDAPSCPGNTVPIQVMTPGYNESGINHSIAEIPDSLPHFRAFVAAVTEHVAARLNRDKLCIKGAESAGKNIRGYERRKYSLLQFVHWNIGMHYDYLVPVETSAGGLPPSCMIASPWIDLVVYREPVPLIRGVVYWNERQLLADQAALAGARSVPPGRAMPLKPIEFGHFTSEYLKSSELRRKPIEERVPPDILWLFRYAQLRPDVMSIVPLRTKIDDAMFKAAEKSAKGYTELVLTLIDRCLASPASVGMSYYGNILDVADPVLLKQYKIDPPLR